MASRFINYKKLRELQEAARGGNEKAKVIIDKYMDDSPDMDSIERLIDDYYGNAGIDALANTTESVDEVNEAISERLEEPSEEVDVEGIEELGVQEPEESVEQPAVEQEAVIDEQPAVEQPIIDISADLDKELDGLIDDNEFDDLSFLDFLDGKRKDANKAKKNAEYFKAYDQGGRESYLSKKKDEYGHSFDGRRRQNERGFNDINGALDIYAQMVTDMPDDEAEFDSSLASKAYDEFTGDKANMGAFGRSWDDSDKELIKTALLALVQQYGKKNVVAVLNTLRDNCSAWRKFNDGKIDNAVSNYGKALDALLK